jgi:hypothetical protein
MSRIRNEVLSGIAAVSLLGAANVARADDHRFKPEFQRSLSQDGRGETSDFRQGRIQPEQVGRAPDRAQPVKPYTEKNATPLPLKAEVKAHFSENTDNVKMPAWSASSAPEDTRTADQIKADRAQIMAQLPMKTEITMRVQDDRTGEGASATAPSAEGEKKSASNRAGLSKLPVKNEIKMRMHSGSDGQADEL